MRKCVVSTSSSCDYGRPRLRVSRKSRNASSGMSGCRTLCGWPINSSGVTGGFDELQVAIDDVSLGVGWGNDGGAFAQHIFLVGDRLIVSHSIPFQQEWNECGTYRKARAAEPIFPVLLQTMNC